MNAEIIAVGTELLLGQIANTNAQFLSEKLAESGINVYYHTAVGDNPERIRDALKIATNRADLVVLTGGLGPTDDDLTKEVVADFLGLALQYNETSLEHMQRFFYKRNRIMPERNKKQALIPIGGYPIYNQYGTAPGVYIEHNDKKYILLPGPPKELQPMYLQEVVPLLEKQLDRHGKMIIHSCVLRFFGIGESELVDRIDDFLMNQSNPTIAPLCSDFEVTLRITAKAQNIDLARQLIEPIKQQIMIRLKEYYFGENDDTLMTVVHQKLLNRQCKIAVAESCTGGTVCQELTSLSGSSTYFSHGLVCYSNEAKLELGVSEETLAKNGAVSEQVAYELARLIKTKGNADLGIGITGIAGPTGGTQDKPVGLVYIGIATNDSTFVRKYIFQGQRESIRLRAMKTTLYLVLKQIERKGEMSDNEI